MAKIKNVELRVEFDAVHEDDITVTVDYDIEFSQLDKVAKVVYHETCVLVGVDTAGSGDLGNGGDDILATMVDRVTTAGLDTVIHRAASKVLKRRVLNEDPSPLQPRDELRAEVRMEDQAGQVAAATGRSAILADRF